MNDMGDYREIRISNDELTGLLDKQTFYECAQELINNNTDDIEFAFIFFDLDNFKLFNVNYGYEIGDELLISIGYIIKDVFEGQLISRFSGDHFVVCTNSIQIIPAIKSIRDRIKLVQKRVNVELKAGIYIYNGEEKDVIRCCDRARMACTSIKKKYDIEYKFYDEELGGSLKRKQEILDSLEEAIEKKYIKVYYQPIVRTLTGKVCGWEALVRWDNPEKGMVYPNEFIPVLEEYRLISKVDAFVIREVLSKYNSDIVRKQPTVPVSMNLSRIDFEALDMAMFLEEQFEKYKCPKDMFHFEVTESVFTDNPQFIMDQINALRDKGFYVWMDDFGSGYSSLNLLKKYQFDLVKIDMDFLSQFETSDNGKIILRHIVSMIKNLGMHTLAEGVETQEQYEFLKSIGCEMIQGYLIGRPMPYIQGLECVSKAHREMETDDERTFYQELGKVDILRQNPLHNIDNGEIENPLSLAIVISEGDKWRIVYANSTFKSVLSSFKYDNLKQMEDAFNKVGERRWNEREHFMDICQHSKITNEISSMDFVASGRIINVRARHLCNEITTNKDAYLISMKLLTRFLSGNNDSRIAEISKAMLARYECVDLFGVEDDYFENIYLSDSRLHIRYQGKTPRDIITTVENQLVHPDDRVFFHEFFDMENIVTRIEDEAAGTIIGFYRILDVRGNYIWKAITVSLVQLDEYRVLLSCVAEAPKEIARRMSDAKNSEVSGAGQVINTIIREKNRPAVENILQLLPIGVFWKGKDRKFLGANQMFLDYYGFQSVEEIIGKTDEDMGWHINPEPFKQDELAVINQGKKIENVHGECIVKGRVRKIVANKQPYIVDRKIEGLVGYFLDITEEVEEHSKLELLTKTDALTGLYNRRAFTEILDKYIEQYNQDSTDFVLMLFDIDKFKQINDLYGHDVGDEVLKKTSRILRKVAADTSVVFRYGGDEFIILHQQKNSAEVESIKQEVRNALGKIDQIGKYQLTVRISIGIARFSTFENISECLDAADKKMYEDKERHKRDK